MRKTAKTRALSLLLALVMVLGLSPGIVWAAEDEMIQIASAEDLAEFRDRVNAGEAALHAVLTADITLREEWTPFNPVSGYVTDAFAGTFDGDGHSISGLNVNDSTTNGVGLFGTVNGAVIRSLKVSGTVAASNSSFVGGIVGKTSGAVTIENCSFDGSVFSGKTGSNAGAGGIVGRVNAGIVTITGCANSAIVSGGCAAGILGYCTSANNRIENCYNTGAISGSSRTGGIGGQVSTTTSITSCFTTAGVVCGFNGKISNSYDESNPPSDASQLGDAFAAGPDGSIILSWQAGTAPAPKDPKITITGSAVLYDTNSGAKPQTTLTVRYTDMSPAPVVWSLTAGTGIVRLELPDSGDVNNSAISVQAVAPGKATVKAEAGEYSDEIEITVFPFVTTAELEGTVAAGETVKAKINVLGGGELDYETFPVKVQWKYKASAADTSFINIPGAVEREFTIPEEYVGKYLSFTCQYQNEDKSPGSPSLVKAAGETDPSPQPPVTDKTLEEALEWYTMYPVSGQDINVNRVLERYLAEQGLEGFTASVQAVKEVYGGAGIASDGAITYFYADPNTSPAIRFGSYQVTFALSKGGETLEKEIAVILYWDAAKVQETIRQEISSKISIPAGAVTSGLSLPKVVDGKTWALISWTSSDEDIISISDRNQSTADTLFEPYIGAVKRGEADQQVMLTATFTFQLTSDVTGEEGPITLVCTYPVTVKAMDATQEEQIRANLLAKLDAGFQSKGLTDAVTGRRLTSDESGVYTVSNDIQLPTTHDFGVDGKYYPVVTTAAGEVLAAPDVNNAARVEVLRPIGKDAEGTITVTLHDRDTSITVSKEFKIKVTALSQEEIDAELALMDRVKAAYFDGIKGINQGKDNVRTDLSPFFEVYADENGELVWVRTNADRTGHGIAPVPMDGWEDLELWRLFKSSNPNVISHETLTVTRHKQAKAVTITSCLSSEALGRYGKLYQQDPIKYAQYAALAPLYYQEVTTDTSDISTQPTVFRTRAAAPAIQPQSGTIVVRGTADPDSAVPVTETLDNVTFSLTGLDGAVWIMPTTLSALDESASVYDVFTRVLTDNGCTATRVKGTYIKAISGPKGSLSEKDYGENSGWMYRVNGQIPDVYMGACQLHSGDTIQVFYTRDAEKDDPHWSWPSTGNSSGNSSSGAPSSGSTSSSGGSAADHTKPVSPAQVEKDKTTGTYVITLEKGRGTPQVVTIPNVKDGQAAVILHPDGQEEIVKKSVLADGKLKLLLQSSASIKLVERSVHFSDVERSAWYASAVSFVSERDLFFGVGGGRFAPELPLSRGMLAAVLYRLEEPEPQTLQNPFDDVSNTAWYAQSVAWAVQAGIVNGYGGGQFGPNDSVTREQLAVMLFRYANTLHMSTSGRDSLIGYSDSGVVSPWAKDAVAWAVDSGIISGLPDGTLAPSGTATRAETAAMLQRFIAVLLRQDRIM